MNCPIHLPQSCTLALHSKQKVEQLVFLVFWCFTSTDAPENKGLEIDSGKKVDAPVCTNSTMKRLWSRFEQAWIIYIAHQSLTISQIQHSLPNCTLPKEIVRKNSETPRSLWVLELWKGVRWKNSILQEWILSIVSFKAPCSRNKS